ncbi:LuxR family transcriptional regulator [Citrobacter amalonaticus]|uniref:LuxR family transcriptional regulator n=1 Tax=Citrobacter amalonaticus TaxID=35703 RepID=A0A2S4RRV4_CITAM|nr:LuxR family transcriptional regulator [Citrobacter amalonaticus]POT58612.1 LuxR family transcriptional regulator [Citrobacter amalonaticus]POT70350.1 LuxR family transcriptional regulator [Citrobacter amalonaticus]POU61334.1 LuxR family transcriptional regulator [Citrobacter amalonaticus]POV05097.1 LuxR family transcriptional regulator [Citrobacter amalonaticus]
MIFIITKDSFLFQGVTHLQEKESVIKINKLSDINFSEIDHAIKIVIDTYHNSIIDEVTVKLLNHIDVDRIIILAPFHISKLKSKSPLFFINRKEQFLNLLSIITDEKISYQKPDVALSHNQLKLVKSIINQQKISDITHSLNISEQTLRIQKFNIMLKLKLRRISDIVTLKISPYF